MARAKKETALTPEERLQAALVPDWEWPYKLPGNWCWTYLTKVAECLDNFRKPINATERAGRNGNVPYYGATGQVGWIDDFLTDEDLVLLGEDGAPFLDLIKDKAYLITGKAWVNNHAHILRSLFGDTGNRYLLHYLNSFNYAGYVNGTTRLKLTRASMDAIPIPIPPLTEQQRIVDRIESLFTKLDEAKEKAQAVVDSFEIRKAAILHKAFTGELTAKWREEHGVGMESWEHHQFSDLCAIVRGGSPRPAGDPRYYDGNIPFMKVADITRNDSPYVSKVEYSIKEEGLKKTRMVEANTLLLTNSGATLGVPAITTIRTTFNDGIAAFIGLDIDSLLFYYYFWTSKTDFLRSINMGAAQPNLNTKLIGEVEIDVPQTAERVEIARVLNALLSKEQQAKEAAEAVLDQSDLMKKSILARAFRGEMGTNDPSEESAVGLLKRGLEKK